jgi:hypothetical protein
VNVSPFYKLEVFIPPESVDELLETLADCHAGEIGKYDHCSSITQVEGTYRPLEGANPAVGVVGKLFMGGECKVEVNVREDRLMDTIQAVREMHPYEEPVINVIPMANHRYGGTM